MPERKLIAHEAEAIWRIFFYMIYDFLSLAFDMRARYTVWA